MENSHNLFPFPFWVSAILPDVNQIYEIFTIRVDNGGQRSGFAPLSDNVRAGRQLGPACSHALPHRQLGPASSHALMISPTGSWGLLALMLS